MTNKVEIEDTEIIDLKITGRRVCSSLAYICKEFIKTRKSRPLDSREEDLAEDILRALGEK